MGVSSEGVGVSSELACRRWVYFILKVRVDTV